MRSLDNLKEQKKTTLAKCRDFIKKSLPLLKIKDDKSVFMDLSLRSAVATDATAEQELVSYLFSQKKFKSIYRDETNINAAVKSFLARYLIEFQAFEYNNLLFKKLFNVFWRELNENFYTWRFVAPVYKLQIDSEIKIGEVRLVPIPYSGPIKEMKQSIKELLRYPGPLDYIDYGKPQDFSTMFASAVCVYSLNIPKEPNFYSLPIINPANLFKPLNDLIICLRLFKSGAVSANWCYGYPVSFHSYYISKFFVLPAGAQFGEMYVLNTEGAQRLRRLMAKLGLYTKSSRKYKRIELALDYFNSSYSKMKTEDRFIDLMVAMDALYGIDKELNYRLSLRVSFLLGKDEIKIREIYKNMQSIYKIRNKILHGGSPQPDKKDIKASASLLEGYVRATINCFIGLSLQGENLDDLVQHFEEEMIISKKKRTELHRVLRP